MRIHLAAAAFIALGVGQAEAKCSMVNFTFLFGFDASTSGTCDAKGMTRIFSSGSGIFDSVTIAKPPAHGSAHTNGRLGYGYHPVKGYHGADSFVIRICGSNMRSKGCTNITYSITAI